MIAPTTTHDAPRTSCYIAWPKEGKGKTQAESRVRQVHVYNLVRAQCARERKSGRAKPELLEFFSLGAAGPPRVRWINTGKKKKEKRRKSERGRSDLGTPFLPAADEKGRREGRKEDPQHHGLLHDVLLQRQSSGTTIES